MGILGFVELLDAFDVDLLSLFGGAGGGRGGVPFAACEGEARDDASLVLLPNVVDFGGGFDSGGEEEGVGGGW